MFVHNLDRPQSKLEEVKQTEEDNRYKDWKIRSESAYSESTKTHQE